MDAHLPVLVAVGAVEPSIRKVESKSMFAPKTAEPSPRYQTTLLNARSRQCRFIVSDRTRDAICCGAPTPENSSWCHWHRQLVYTPKQSHRGQRRAA
jgi:hypothetical protein